MTRKLSGALHRLEMARDAHAPASAIEMLEQRVTPSSTDSPTTPERSTSATSTCAGNQTKTPEPPPDSGNNSPDDRVAPTPGALPGYRNSATNNPDHRYQQALLAISGRSR